ncbi:MAG: M24 family metallopeptidase [Spirochaetes bacterium]|nr:M24 family metallopeptidase [Spirochaetota bacterium]
MIDISKVEKAILEENLSGWLFFNFRHRDPIADMVLKIDKKSTNSRGWFYIIKGAEGYIKENIKIIHSVEPDVLKNYPGKTVFYTSKEELKEILKQFAGMTLAAQADPDLTQISFLDSGTASILQKAGIKIVSSASLVKKIIGTLDNEQILSHEKAAALLYKIIEETWDYLSINFKKNQKITEKSIQSFIIEKFEENNLVSDSLPLVAFGKNSANPHYKTGENDFFLEKNSIIQFDIWAKLLTEYAEQADNEKCVYADISWVGFAGEEPPQEITKSFNAIKEARDSVIAFIRENLEAGNTVLGFDADKKARNILLNRGYKNEIKHRTGHAIDIELHGYGTNLDSVEFPDKRTLSNGSCFSVEPGLYFKDFGIRTEINCYIQNNMLYISGGLPQNELLVIQYPKRR